MPPRYNSAMASERDKPRLKSSKGEPPRDPPVALGLFDDGDYIRHLGDKIAALSPSESECLLQYLEQTGVA